MEYMATLTGGIDESKPSLFELLSESQLNALLPPSLRYLLVQATHRYPRYFIRVLNSFDEVYALLALLVERHFLTTYAGSFTENFYGLKRERVLQIRAPQHISTPEIPGGNSLPHALPRAQLGATRDVREILKLRERDIWKNLAIIVGIPYIKRKLDEAYDIHAAPLAAGVLLGGGPSYAQQNADAVPPDATFRQRLLYYYKWFLRKVYPHVNAAYHFAMLAFQLAYLFDATAFSSPFLWMASTRIRRLGAADAAAAATAAAASTSASEASRKRSARPGQSNSLFHPRVLLTTVWPKLLSSLRFLLPTSVLALKFLEWWHASDFARQLARKAREDIEVPPPVVASSWADEDVMRGRREQTAEKTEAAALETTASAADKAPKSATSGLPVFTVPLPSAVTSQKDIRQQAENELLADGEDESTRNAPDSSLCPICAGPIQTATASPYGYVYCYTCIHRWVEGTHPRQEEFMKGISDNQNSTLKSDEDDASRDADMGRNGEWESGKGRDAVTGLSILGGTSVLRRIVV